MQKPLYNWQRYWYQVTPYHHPPLLDGGYLFLPDQDFAHLLPKTCIPLQKLAKTTPCLILLGEPGSGKTSELIKLERLLREQRNGDVLRIELGKNPTEQQLRNKVFNSPEYRSWLAGTHRLYLLLDGLDEWPLDITIPFYLLINSLPQALLPRISVCLTCRTTDWHHSFEDDLKPLWGTIQTYQITPLRREDVSQATLAHSIDTSHFLNEVDRRGLVPLAAHPFTLEMLLSIYRPQKAFPDTSTALYREGCRRLCDELNDRHQARRKRKLDREQRLHIASRIAALTIFANRAAIWTGVYQEHFIESDLPLHAILGNREQVLEQEIVLNEDSIKETLNTGLFTSQGAGRVGWSHSTYAQFLAAHYLTIHDIPLVQIMELLTHYVGGARMVIPQLYETAAWTATMRPDVFRELLQLEPELLLRGDLASRTDQERQAVVSAVLGITATRLGQLHFNFRHLYHKLRHETLSAQLLPYLSNTSTPLLTCVVAISIGAACHLSDLQERLLTLALDTNQPGPVREAATEALISLGNDSTKTQLKPLLALLEEQESNNEIKGYVLLGLWPTHLHTQELFTALTSVRSKHFSTAHRRFLQSPFVKDIPLEDLPIALAWIERLPARHFPLPPWPLQQLLFDVADQITLRAWRYLDRPEILEACARVISSRIRLLDSVLCGRETEAQALLNHADKYRSQLLQRTLALLSQQSGWAVRLYSIKPQLFRSEDIFWLLSFLSSKQGDVFQREIALLVRLLFQPDADDQQTAVMEASQTNVFLRNEMELYFAAQKQIEIVAEDDTISPSPPMEDRVSQFMIRLATMLQEEVDPIEIWERFWSAVRNHPDLASSTRPFTNTTFPAWGQTDPATREQLLLLGKQYLERYEPGSQDWITTTSIPRTAWHAYKTLQLVAQEDSTFLPTLPLEQWCKLIPALVAISDPVTVEIDRKLLRMAQQVATNEVAKTTVLFIDNDMKNLRSQPILEKMSRFWDEALEQALLTKLQEPTLPPGSLEWLLRILLAHDVQQAEQFAYTLITNESKYTDEEECERAATTVKVLLFHAKKLQWSSIWTSLRANWAFGKKVVGAIIHASLGQFLSPLTEHELADLYLWSIEHFPPADAPSSETVEVEGVVDNIALWQQGLIQQLSKRGTLESVAAISRIIREQPDMVDQLNLGWHHLDAQRLAARQTWRPFDSKDLLTLLYHPHVRLVQSGEQLLEVVIESLGVLERKFKDETPAWRDVWDRVPTIECPKCHEKIRPPQAHYRPIEEEEFSNYLKRHLSLQLGERGIIANREVEISSGERTDIHIVAAPYNQRDTTYNRLTVIVEVKGCWNQEWKKSLQGQLVDRYLKGNSCQNGLYLLGWFLCDEWDRGDYRYEDASKQPIEEARAMLDAQAASSSIQGLNVKALILDARITRTYHPTRLSSSTSTKRSEKNKNP